MVLDKSIETLEDLVRFLNRKQGFYFKLYDRYLEGDLSDYDHLDDSRKDEVDCNAVCDDIVECIKAISEEAQVRGLAKKAKVLCTLDGQDEERCILDEWLLKVVRLLDDDVNWNRMLAPIEGEDMNNVFYAILFRLTYVVNFLNELSTKTEQEYYGGRRTDVMPYYIGESKLKEAQSISLGSALSIFEDIAEEYGLQAGIDFGEDMKSKSIFFKNLPLEDGEENELEDKLKAALPGLNVRHWQSGTSYFRNRDGKHINEISFEVSSSGLKETSTILLTSHHKTELPNSNAPVRDGCSKCGDRSPDKVLQALKYWCDDFNIEDISGPEDNERICVDCFKKICKDRGVSLKKKHWWLKEGLGKGFGQGLFDKDSVLTSKSKDDIEFEKFSKRFHDLMNDDEGWSEPPVCSECGWNPTYSDDIKTVDEWLEERNIPYSEAFEPVDRMICDDCFDELVANCNLRESKERRKPLKELTQDEFNRLARERDEFRAQTAISPVEKNNLYADIKDFEEEFRDLQATAERLPDSYIDRVCGTASYPFEDVIDEVQNVEDWCSEAEEFLKDDINSWGTMRESDKTYKAKAGKKWLKGDKFVKSKAAADSFESKTEPTQRLNQMKKDGKLDKDAKIDVVEESIFDFEAQNQPMYRFAKQKHDATGAIRKHSGDPYWVHPEGVAKIAAAYGGADVEIQAAMAHDTLEDTNCSYDELEEMFGDEVASIVREITNDTEEVDRLGKEQYINLELISLSHPALFVKLCDMYYNQMDFPAEAQKQRMIKNINYLLANREDDLNENEIALIEDILQTLLN